MDNLKNGTIFGALAGLAVAGGNYIIEFLKGVIPANAMVFGAWSLWVYLVAIGALTGYIIDRY